VIIYTVVVCLCKRQRIIVDYGTGFIQEEKDEDSAPLMVLEYMQYGDLASFLKSYRYVYIYIYRQECSTNYNYYAGHHLIVIS
jgi:hypothetical protein